MYWMANGDCFYELICGQINCSGFIISISTNLFFFQNYMAWLQIFTGLVILIGCLSIIEKFWILYFFSCGSYYVVVSFC